MFVEHNSSVSDWVTNPGDELASARSPAGATDRSWRQQDIERCLISDGDTTAWGPEEQNWASAGPLKFEARGVLRYVHGKPLVAARQQRHTTLMRGECLQREMPSQP